MKVPIAIALELVALCLVVATVSVAVRLLWPSLLAAAAALAYMAHAWDWEDGSVTLRPVKLRFWQRSSEAPDA